MTTRPAMTSMQRVLAALGHQEPDQVPVFLPVTLHGARELDLSIRDYFSEARYVVEGQLRMRAKFRHDCLYAFFYAALEVEAWGGEVIYREDGPASSGEPFVRRLQHIRRLEAPRVLGTACLAKVLQTIQLLKAQVGSEVPIIGMVTSPFSVPVMQLGFEPYLDLMFEQPDLFEHLMQVNEAFCVDWANAQLAAGATAIWYSTRFPPAPSFPARSTCRRALKWPSARWPASRAPPPRTSHPAVACPSSATWPEPEPRSWEPRMRKIWPS